MRKRLPVVMALPLAAAMLALAAAPAAADPSTIVTTPIPQPANPNDPPASGTADPHPTGRAVGDAGTGLAVVRLLPNSAPTGTILPGYSDKLPKQPAAELGFGLSSAQANSEAYLAQERSIAQASPGGFAFQGNTPQTPGSLAQMALPDNKEPITGGLNPPSTPLDTLLKVGALQGQVHARWSETLGPCVGTISDASTSLGSLSVLNAIPTLPNFTELDKAFDMSKLTDVQQQATKLLSGLAGPLSSLGGVLPTGGKGTGSLLSLPNTMSTRSVVRLVDLPGSKHKAVQSVSTLQVASVKLLANTPMEISLNVVSQPTLTATSGGDAKTSTITYKAPVITVTQGGKDLGTLSSSKPSLDIPIGVPLPKLENVLPSQLKNLPLVGNVAALLDPSQLSGLDPNQLKIDIGVLRLNVAELTKKELPLEMNGLKGYQIGATARMLDLQLLPTDALALPDLPSALAQVSLGEQVTRAAAPEGGVVCGKTSAPTQNPPAGQGSGPKHLAYTNAAYQAVPMFWSGTAMLLVGVVIVAAMPGRRPQRVTVKPSPSPRPPTED
ncbi:hypothetical protein [Labedaea rhizosphaerae]|uniref:Uncharacterized protein n=1 Tax=Labedaea rhizosphaerae TaxID=598644 RepID=A0A4R6SLK0_LABRH|nr:hypothetical protein [Labedaea rhizosphaerae]TDQ04731.1 hypothetical protein EV186_101687 [Labedaea rhizosphaerae]